MDLAMFAVPGSSAGRCQKRFFQDATIKEHMVFKTLFQGLASVEKAR